MGVLTRVLAGLLARWAGLLGPERRDWADALLAEAGESPPGWARAAWLGGGLWLVAREALRHRVMRVLAFAAAAAGVVWVTWPGSSSDSAVPVNRVEVPVILALLAVLPLLVRRHFGPARGGWLVRAVRAGGYAVALALIVGQAVQARAGQQLGAYFYDHGILRGLMLLVIAGYVTVILIVTSRRVRLTRSSLPIAIGTAAAVVLVAFARTGLNVFQMQARWWALTELALPLATGFAVARVAARDTSATVTGPARQGALGAICATGTAALMLAALTTLTVALFPQRVPLQTPPPPANGGCETCEPVSLVIPVGLRHEYWVDLSVDQAGGAVFIVLAAPFLTVFFGAIGVGLASASRRRSGQGGDRHAPSPPAPSSLP
jgi:hypothetical protein